MIPKTVYMVVTIVDEGRFNGDCFEKRTEYMSRKVFVSLEDAEVYCAMMNHEHYDDSDDWDDSRTFFAVRELEVK